MQSNYMQVKQGDHKEEVKQPEGNITDVQDSYKYLEILQANSTHDVATRKLVTTKYL